MPRFAEPRDGIAVAPAIAVVVLVAADSAVAVPAVNSTVSVATGGEHSRRSALSSAAAPETLLPAVRRQGHRHDSALMLF